MYFTPACFGSSEDRWGSCPALGRGGPAPCWDPAAALPLVGFVHEWQGGEKNIPRVSTWGRSGSAELGFLSPTSAQEVEVANDRGESDSSGSTPGRGRAVMFAISITRFLKSSFSLTRSRTNLAGAMHCELAPCESVRLNHWRAFFEALIPGQE